MDEWTDRLRGCCDDSDAGRLGASVKDEGETEGWKDG